MQAFILGQKIKNSQVFTDKGERASVFMVNTAPCYLLGIQTVEKNGYFSAVVGYGKTKKNQKPVAGKLKKANVAESLAHTREIRLDESVTIVEKDKNTGIKIGEVEIYVGDKISPTLFFTPDMNVDVTGVSKGKGFAGVVKRHDFAGFPASHGHPHQRVPGSVGSTTTPGRVFKGLRMAGRMGSETVTVQNLKIVSASENELVIKGQAPGKNNTLLTIVSSK